MVNYMENLSVTEADRLRKTIAGLFRQTCILQEKYDPVTLVPTDNEQYKVCVRHRAFIEAYLEVLGCELSHDGQEHVFRLTGEGVPCEQVSKTATILILLIKMIYRDKIMGNGLAATVTNLIEIREYGKNTNLLNRKLTEAEWSEALSLMKRHQIIEYPGALRDIADETPIYIYGTINLYCSLAMLNELTELYGEENTADETAKEDFYQDAYEQLGRD